MTTSHIAIEVLRSWDDVQRRLPTWDESVCASPDGSIFQTLEWGRAWWHAYGQGELVIFAFRDERGEDVGIAPFYLDTTKINLGLRLRALRLIGDGSSDSDNLGIIYKPGFEATVLEKLFTWLRENRTKWDLLEFGSITSESMLARMLKEKLSAADWKYSMRCSARQVIHFTGGWEDYLNSLSKKMRTGISYQMRRVQAKHQHLFKKCEREEEIPSFLDTLFALHTGRWGTKGKAGAFQDENRRRFYLEISSEFLRKGWLDFWVLEIDGTRAAAEYGFHLGHDYSFLQGGFDHQLHQLSLGVVLKGLVIQELLKRNMRTHDFLGGSDEYKQRWGATMQSYSHFQIASGVKGATYLHAVAWASRAKSFIPRALKDAVKRVAVRS